MSSEAPSPEELPPEDDSENSPLDHVVDDLDEERELAEWADAALVAGRTPEELVDELLEQGWSRDDAEVRVEAARVRTRRERGILTRDDVANTMRARYSKGMRTSWFAGFPSLSSAWRLMIAVGSVLTLKRWRRR
jgi:hypothetical protein